MPANADQGRLTSPRIVRDVLARHGVSLKKQLGQNFLVDLHVLDAIVAASQASETTGILEIGPGAGVVTQALGAVARRVVAVEKDSTLQPVLAETLAGLPNIELVFDDFLKVDVLQLWRRFADCERTAVVANLPYYVTTPILFHLLDSGVPWSRIVVMVQKEVADRLCAPPGGKDYGALTVSVRYRADVRVVLQVSRNAFLPPPNVDSTVVCLERHVQPVVAVADEAMMFRVIRAAFATRRKTLLNALSSTLGWSKEEVRAHLEKAGVDGMRRGETLALAEFACIANSICANKR